MSLKKDPRYLGDAVYVTRREDGTLVLTTNHHDPQAAAACIYLEPGVWEALKEYAQDVDGL